MAEARQYANWSQTSALLALTANVNRDPKKHRAFQPDDFNPFAKNAKKKTKSQHADMATMKAMFVKKK